MRTTRKARIAYDGPAIANGEMDVHELAPALITFDADNSTTSNEDICIEETHQREMLAKIVTINTEKSRWQLSDGNNPAFWATVADEKLKNRIDNQEITFPSDDIIRIKCRHKQVIKQGKLTSEYIVDEVMEVKKAPTQIKLDFEYKGENS